MTAGRLASVRGNLRPWLLAAVLAAGLGGAGAYYFWPRPPAPGRAPSAPLPPLTDSPFLNARPDIAYVGDQGCADCHPDQSKAYRQHPMGRSLFTAAHAPPLEKEDTGANNPFQSGPFRFQVVRQGSRLIHREWCQDAGGKVVAQTERDIAFAMGSGSQARSYLWERDGFLFQSPITWFTRTAERKSEWNLSPGYEKNLLHFDRTIDRRCLYCHAQEAHPLPDTVNHYGQPPFGQLAIGCERCHGPGTLHVAGGGKSGAPGEIDRTIVNPKHLAPALREAVCEQCHLQGEAVIVRRGRAQTDYRPGLPLSEYVSIFVRPPTATDAGRIVSHVEQMHLSACFRKSDGKFGCTSCHDPHRQPASDEKVTLYRQRCLNCHKPAGQLVPAGPWVKAPDCSAPPARRAAKEGDNCLACHMPRNASSNVTHFAVTDHRVLRDPDHPSPPPPEVAAGESPLLLFHRDPLNTTDEEQPRDLGLALTHLAELAHDLRANRYRDYLTQRALPLLEKAVVRAPDDVEALEARGFARFAQGRLDEALKDLEDVLAQAPDRERALSWAARVAEDSGRLDQAEQYARRAAEKYPQLPQHHFQLAGLYARREAWPQAIGALETGLRGDPFKPEPRALLITALLETGARARAQAEGEILGVMHPDYQAKIRTWFAERLRQTSR